MEIKQTLSQGLKREFEITVPAQFIEEKLLNKLETIGKKVKIPGFRPGKIPLPLLKQRYKSEALSEVLEDIVENAVNKALTENKLKPALKPQVNVTNYEDGKNLQFQMSMEVIPSIGEINLDNLSFERIVVKIPQEQVNKVIENIAKQNRTTKPIEKQRKTQKGDIVIIDFEGFIGKEPIEGGAAKAHALELGSSTFIPGFEDQLIGQEKNAHVDVKVKFPETYHDARYADKAARFDVTIHDIHEAEPIVIDNALSEKLGFKSIEEMNEWIEKSISKDYISQSYLNTKRHVLDALAERFKFDVPQNMVELEFENIWTQLCRELGINQNDAANANTKGKVASKSFEESTGKSEKELREEYRIIAERRVRLGILLAEIGNSNKITVSNQELSNALLARAREFPGQEKEVYEYYKSNEAALASLRAPLFENKVIDFILNKSKINEKQLSPDAFEKFLVKEEEEAEKNLLSSSKKPKKSEKKKDD